MTEEGFVDNTDDESEDFPILGTYSIDVSLRGGTGFQALTIKEIEEIVTSALSENGLAVRARAKRTDR